MTKVMEIGIKKEAERDTPCGTAACTSVQQADAKEGPDTARRLCTAG